MHENAEISGKVCDCVTPIKEQQNRIQQIADSVKPSAIALSLPVLEQAMSIADSGAMRTLQENWIKMDAVTENLKAMQKIARVGSAFESIYNSRTIRALGEITMKTAISTYKLEIPTLKAIDAWNTSAITNLAAGLTALVTSPVMQEIKSISSCFGKWLQTVDFSPLTSIWENIKDIGFKYDYEEVNEIFLNAMFDARWFPYAGWIADFEIVDKMLEILDTSKVSKNRVKRIDKLIFSYYSKDEIDNIKRGWRQMSLPSYMTRILVQSIQAYHRREYALTVSALSTLWEGIIQEKMRDNSYRVSRKTRENLTKLIEENDFDEIFSSFCEEFIFYDCRNVEDVKPDVPGRHGIAHCWYNTYPNRKMALNAILFTDFLLGLKPLEKAEEDNNG